MKGFILNAAYITIIAVVLRDIKNHSLVWPTSIWNFWINVYPTFIKIIGPMILFLSRDEVICRWKIKSLRAERLQRSNRFIGKKFNWSFMFILNVKNFVKPSQKPNKMCSWIRDLKFYLKHFSQRKIITVFSSSSITCIYLSRLLTPNLTQLIESYRLM